MSNATTSFEKRFPKLDYKAVSVIMIAKSEKMKMKKSHLPHFFGIFCLLPPPLGSPVDFFKVSPPALSNFMEISFPPQKKRGRGEETMMYKNSFYHC